MFTTLLTQYMNLASAHKKKAIGLATELSEHQKVIKDPERERLWDLFLKATSLHDEGFLFPGPKDEQNRWARPETKPRFDQAVKGFNKYFLETIEKTPEQSKLLISLYQKTSPAEIFAFAYVSLLLSEKKLIAGITWPIQKNPSTDITFRVGFAVTAEDRRVFQLSLYKEEFKTEGNQLTGSTKVLTPLTTLSHPHIVPFALDWVVSNSIYHQMILFPCSNNETFVSIFIKLSKGVCAWKLKEHLRLYQAIDSAVLYLNKHLPENSHFVITTNHVEFSQIPPAETTHNKPSFIPRVKLLSTDIENLGGTKHAGEEALHTLYENGLLDPKTGSFLSPFCDQSSVVSQSLSLYSRGLRWNTSSPFEEFTKNLFCQFDAEALVIPESLLKTKPERIHFVYKENKKE
jgi:hypothetical protein